MDLLTMSISSYSGQATPLFETRQQSFSVQDGGTINYIVDCCGVKE